MQHNIIFIFNLFLFAIALNGQNNFEDHQVFVVGNLDGMDSDALELKSLENTLSQQTGEFTLLVAGDFTSEKKWKKKSSDKEFAIIDKLISLVGDRGNIVFIPGEKEWDRGSDNGFDKVKKVEKYIENKIGKHRSFFPEGGCPGPTVVEVNNHLKIIIIDSQWFLQDNRPEEEDAACKYIESRELWDELSGLLSEEDNKNTIVALHHPILSFGSYAGYTPISKHLSPPVIGSIVAAYKRNVGGKLNLNNESFREFSTKMMEIAQDHQGLIFVSGHEYDLQLIDHFNSFYISSGSISKSKHVANKKETIFSKSTKGFTKIGFAGSGKVDIDFYKIKKDNTADIIFHKQLYAAPCEKDLPGVPLNPSFSPCADEKVVTYSEADRKFPESGSAIPDAEYKKSGFGRFWLGKYYRDVWAAPVNNVPYLDITKVEGGLVPYAEGGAGESTSLKFKTKDGRKFAFRSVDKDPQRRLPEELQNTLVSNINKDMIAHQHPFGPLVAKVFLEKLGLPHTDPKLFIMPDDPALGRHRETFKEMLGTLEIKPEGKKRTTPGYRNADKVHGTFQMYRKLLDDSKNRLEVEGYIKSRLFNIWMADWDRHEDQWKWLGYETDEGLVYKVFPKDMDKVFAILDGLYSIMDWESMSETIGTFRDDYKGLESLNFKSRNMDRWLTNRVTKEVWLKEVKEFVQLMSDEVIEEALSAMPPEAYKASADRIRKGLKIRRDKLPEAIEKYYGILAKYIDIPGTNKHDKFIADRKSNGDVEVTVFRINKKGEEQEQIYNRLFKQNETKEIRLYGLGEEDEFSIEGYSDKSILIRIVGGRGADSITDKSNVKGGRIMTRVYDVQKKDKLDLGSEAKTVDTYEEIKFNSQTLFDYDYSAFTPKFGFNSDDGWIFGFNYSKIKRGFGTREYLKKTKIGASFTTQTNFNFNLDQIWRRRTTKWDLILGVKGARNDRFFQQFYGFGNNSVIDIELDANQFYRNSLSIYQGKIGLNRTFWYRSQFQLSLLAEYLDVNPRPMDDEGETIYDDFSEPIGLGSSFLAGPEMNLVLDFTDNKYLPTRGMKFKFYGYGFYNSDENLDFGGRIDAEGTVYISVGNKKPITLSVRGGYSQVLGDVPFYYQSTIGQQSNHRGYNRNRFVGNRAAFFNNDLRFHLGSIQTPLVSIKYGVYGLYDIGRVWIDDEISDNWHTAWGGGFYIMPYKEQFNFNFTYARSEEEKSIISVGLGFFVH